MTGIVLCGEAMLELSQGGSGWRLGFGGDTLNTAIHLARAGHDVAYLTAIGEDPTSAGLVPQWQAEGLDTTLVLRHPARAPCGICGQGPGRRRRRRDRPRPARWRLCRGL